MIGKSSKSTGRRPVGRPRGSTSKSNARNAKKSTRKGETTSTVTKGARTATTLNARLEKILAKNVEEKRKKGWTENNISSYIRGFRSLPYKH